MKKPLVVANWKMNPDAPGRAAVLANKIERSIASIRGVEVVIAPPFPFLLPVAAVIKRAKLGSQDAYWEDAGAHTGEVSWHQLKHMRVMHVIVGHSERRFMMGETDEMIRHKVAALAENSMTPILCVGERERKSDGIPDIVGAQIEAALTGIKKTYLKNLVIAYEPVWAISTTPNSRPDTPANALRAMMYIRDAVSRLFDRVTGDDVRVIYGGSVTGGNITGFLEEGRMQGALVGGASLDPVEFKKIVTAAARVIL